MRAGARLERTVVRAGLSSYYTFYLIEKFHVPVGAAQLYLFLLLAAVAAGFLPLLGILAAFLPRMEHSRK